MTIVEKLRGLATAYDPSQENALLSDASSGIWLGNELVSLSQSLREAAARIEELEAAFRSVSDAHDASEARVAEWERHERERHPTCACSPFTASAALPRSQE